MGPTTSGTIPYAWSIPLWSGYAALALIILSGILGLAGSAMLTKTGKMLLLVTGILAILAAIIFIAGFMTLPGGSQLLFYNVPGVSASLWIGWGLALVAGILAFVSWAMHPTTTAPSK